MDDETTAGEDDLRWRRRQGWWLAVGLPPGPVLALSGIVTFFLFLTWEMDEYEKQLRRRTKAGLWLLLLLGLLALAVLVAHHALQLVDAAAGGRRLVVVVPTPTYVSSDGDGGGGTSPWAVAAVVALLLVLASHKPSSFHLFRPPLYHR
jgi:hypothetical protein